MLKPPVYLCNGVQPCVEEERNAKGIATATMGTFCATWQANAHESENNVILQLYWRKKAATVTSSWVVRELGGGGVESHSHSNTGSADTSWDIRPVRMEYKQEDAGRSNR